MFCRTKFITNLAVLCGVGAFYAQQTDQDNWFVGFLVASAVLIIADLRKTNAELEKTIEQQHQTTDQDELWRRMDVMNEDLRDYVDDRFDTKD